METREIRLVCDWQTNDALKSALEAALPRQVGVELQLRESERVFRSPSLDPTVLVALVGGTSAAISALITGLFSVLQSRKQENAKIVLKGADGRTVEAPAAATREQLTQLIELAARLDEPTIHIVTPSGRQPKR